jgi:hypothetical protein
LAIRLSQDGTYAIITFTYVKKMKQIYLKVESLAGVAICKGGQNKLVTSVTVPGHPEDCHADFKNKFSVEP